MKRNVAWAFYSLQEDVNCDLRKYFKQETTTRDDFAYPRVLTEDDRMACLEITIRNHYGLRRVDGPAKLTRITKPGITDGFCQFTGGGDIYIFI